MPNHALCVITGHLGKDAELAFLPQKGTPVLKFSVCVSTGYGDKKTPTWWNVAFFGQRAEKLAPMLRKGDPVTVVGEPSLRKYTSERGDGQSLEVRAADIVLLGTRRDSGLEGYSPVPQSEAPQSDSGEDVPF